MMKTIEYNAKKIQDDVFSINQNAKIVAVTKTVSTELVNQAYDCGIKTIGENRVQEFLQKFDEYKSCDVHFIGSLQKNKAKYIVDKVTMVQSVDSVELAFLLDKLCKKRDKVLDILIQINISKEPSKSGIFLEDIPQFLENIAQMRNINTRGFMTIPKKNTDYLLEKDFDAMHELFSNYDEFDTLSMGMSGDYKLALKHGSNMVRIGSGLFGNRAYI